MSLEAMPARDCFLVTNPLATQVLRRVLFVVRSSESHGVIVSVLGSAASLSSPLSLRSPAAGCEFECLEYTDVVEAMQVRL